MRWRAGGLGLLAQVFTLGATFLPIAWGAGEGLVVLVVATAVATIATPALSLAAQYRLPVAPNARDLMSGVVSSALACVVGAAIVAVVTFAVALLSNSDQPWAWAAAVGGLSAAQAAFTIAMGVLVRANSYAGMMRARLAYGVTTFAATVAALLLGGSGLALCAAAAAGFVVGATLATSDAVANLRARKMNRPGWKMREAGAYAWDARTLAASATVGAVAGQLGALVTPGLGPLSVAWATAIRVMSGFQTIGAVVVGAAIDTQLSRAVRTSDATTASAVSRRATLAGLGLGVVSVGAAVVAIVWVAGGDSMRDLAFLTAVILYCGTNVALAPIGRALGLLGQPRVRLMWDTARCAIFGVAFLLPAPTLVLLAFGLGGVLGYISYAILLRRALRELPGPTVA